ncbi:trypsin-like serine peptidase [Lysinibacillus sp. NPDC058147]|uniref:trypsin-like serine peptidase n=1 Tax=unclassified Lysinibacillus TaxID=2636778 RepID=UPI0036DE27D0
MESIVRLHFYLGSSNKKQSASASIIKYNDELYVATAAHCIYDVLHQEKARDIYIEVQGTKRIYIKIPVIILPKEWSNTGDLSFDYAFGKIPPMKEKENIEYFEPLFEHKENITKETELYLGGYPISFLNTKLKITQGKLNLMFLKKEGLIGIHSAVKPGVSGGPCFLKKQDKYYQLGVTSFKLRKFKKIVWATSWDYCALEILENLDKSNIKEGYIFI